MKKAIFIFSNLLIILSGFTFYLLQMKSVHHLNDTVNIYIRASLIIFVSAILIIAFAYHAFNKRTSIKIIIYSFSFCMIAFIIAVIQSYRLFNAAVKFEAYRETNFGYVNIVIRENLTYKIEMLEGANSNYFYGTYKITGDTLALKSTRPGGTLFSGNFLIKNDSLFKFGNEGQLIISSEYAYKIFTTDSTD